MQLSIPPKYVVLQVMGFKGKSAIHIVRGYEGTEA
jgi:hypothetical protein